jgi:ABC-type Fe3+-siderophore transport system permease subunit
MIQMPASFIDRRLMAIGAAITLAALLFWWSLSAFSPFVISQADTVAGVFNGGQGAGTSARIVAHIRLPRALAAALIGATLGLCGLLMQGITRNRLASPTILGVTGGASLGLAFVSTGLIVIPFAYDGLIATILGGAFAWVLVFLLGTAWSLDASKGRLVLAGITIAALCAGLTRLLVLLAEERALGMLNWLAGSLANIRFPEVQIMAVVFFGGLILSVLVASRLNLVNLGNETAHALGVRLKLLRGIIFVAGCIMTGATVATAGPIGFIGLMAPNIARIFVGSDYRPLVPMTAAVGAVLLLAADIAARAVAFPAETPAGAVAALIGAPFFLLMARSQK